MRIILLLLLLTTNVFAADVTVESIGNGEYLAVVPKTATKLDGTQVTIKDTYEVSLKRIQSDIDQLVEEKKTLQKRLAKVDERLIWKRDIKDKLIAAGATV